MAEYNKVILLGNLTRDPDLRYTPAGLAVCEFPLAVTHKYRIHDEVKEEVCYIDVVVFGRSAEPVKEHLRRGARALVDGRLTQRRWETPEGQKRSKYEVVAATVQFFDAGSAPESGHEDDLPI
ncbi:MAG TPA: single-stranded DNA-binding protein [Candidatus Binatia bacterium]|jgi:single-strand DNA-binding protein